ncbi:MAG: transporter substrate-binding protein [Variovorax sp.]|nr:transporter substrate-binding protein [Variovorax sp.]
MHNSTQPDAGRRALLKAGAAAPLAILPTAAFIPKLAQAAEFSYKLGTALDASHPLNIRIGEALTRIRQATAGRVDIKLFPANQLGSDADTLSQTRSGAVEFMCLGHGNLGNYVRSSAIASLGFAFKNYEQVWAAMDGELGEYIRADIRKTNMIVPVSRMWDNGFRQVTSSDKAIRTPADLQGFKLRVPPNPAYTTLFKALGAGPTPINFNDLYTSLQTRVVEGQENPLALIDSAKLYEVQKFCSITNHIWDGFWLLGNQQAWQRLPSDLQQTVTREFDRSVADERADIAKRSESLQTDLAKKGLQFVQIDPTVFRSALNQTTFYKEWREKYGAAPWALLEKVVGKLG